MRIGRFATAALLLFSTAGVFASDAKPWQPDTGDTAWMLVSIAFVLLMTPGLAMFYGGMVRRKNVLGTMMQSWILMGLISVEWALIGYSVAFDKGGSFRSKNRNKYRTSHRHPYHRAPPPIRLPGCGFVRAGVV